MKIFCIIMIAVVCSSCSSINIFPKKYMEVKTIDREVKYVQSLVEMQF